MDYMIWREKVPNNNMEIEILKYIYKRGLFSINYNLNSHTVDHLLPTSQNGAVLEVIFFLCTVLTGGLW